MKINKKLSLTAALVITSGSFGMEKETDIAALLQENNKLLQDIKRQNRVIIKQNFLNYQHQNLHTELCSSRAIAYSCSEKDKLENKYKIATKIKEVYLGEKLTDLSWSISDEDK
jgi:hypothetical protein